MAFVVEEIPSADVLTSTLQPVIVVLSDAGYTEDNYQFAVRVKTSADVVLATLYLQPNNNDAAVFDLASILDSYAVGPSPWQTNSGNLTDNFVFLSGSTHGDQDELTSRSQARIIGPGDPIFRPKIDVGYSASATPGAAPSVTWVTSNLRINCIRWAGADSDTASYGSVQAFSGATLATLSANQSNVPLLSDVPLYPAEIIAGYNPSTLNTSSDIFVDYVNDDSYRVMVWPIGDGSSDDLDRDADYVRITWFSASGSVLGNYTTDIASLGDAVLASSANNNQKALPMLAIGPGNVRNNTANAGWAGKMSLSTWVYYDVILYSSSTLTAANQRSAIYRFRRVDNACLYDQYTLFFSNTSGGWDAIDISMEHEEQVKLDSKQEYESSAGNYLTAGPSVDFSYLGVEGGTRRRRVRTRKEVRVGTGWWPEERNQLMESLFMSTDVYEVRDGSVVRILLNERKFDYKTRNADGRFRYTFSYQYARTRTR